MKSVNNSSILHCLNTRQYKIIKNNLGGKKNVKHIKPENSTQELVLKVADNIEGEEKQLINECKIMNSLKSQPHPNLLSPEALFPDHNPPFLLLPYIKNGDLLDFIDTFKPDSALLRSSDPTIKGIVEGIAKALMHMHAKHIIHRDLKPENILVSEENKPLVADFGFAKQLKDENDKTKTFCGTVYYIAPEIAENARTPLNQRSPYGIKVDMWSFGALTFSLLTQDTLMSKRVLFPKQDKIGDDKLLIAIAYMKKKDKLMGFVEARLNFHEGKHIDNTAKDFLHKLLSVRASYRMNAIETIDHPYLMNTQHDKKADNEIEEKLSALSLKP